MTLYKSNSLDEMEQIEAFWDGVLIGKREEGEFTIECRQIDDFYAEYKSRENFYADMRSFRNPNYCQNTLTKWET
jgi:hypothetical protein